MKINLIDVGSANGNLPPPLNESAKYIDHRLCFDPLAKRNRNAKEQVLPLALWEVEGTLPFYVTANGHGSSLFPHNHEYVRLAFSKSHPDYQGWKAGTEIAEITPVPCTILDHPFPSKRTYHLLKLDAQGAEYRILRGGTNYLVRDCLAVHCELNLLPLYRDIDLGDKVIAYLEALGFALSKLFRIQGSFKSWRDGLFLKPGDSPAHQTIRRIYNLT